MPGMPAQKKTSKPKSVKRAPIAAVKVGKSQQKQPVAKAARHEPSGNLPEEVKRLWREVESLHAQLIRKPGLGNEGGGRRDQDKIVADRLARLDEKIESLWGRVADLEEHLEGEGGRSREPDVDEIPDRDFYEH